MAYTRAWSETRPNGATTPANQIDSEIQYTRQDMRERIAGIFGMNLAEFTADPVVPKSLTLSGALIAATVAGTFTGNLTGNVTGTASLATLAANATKLATARSINGVAFDGTADITISAGTVGTLTFGTYLQASSTSFSGSNATISTNATSANTASTIVARDGSGNFSAGTVTASLTGNVTGSLTGNASTATTLATPRAINGVNFDGSAAITVTAAAGTLTGTTLNSSVVTSSLTAIGTLVSGAITASLITAGTFGSGAFAFGGAVSGITTLSTSSTINGQTISSAASFTGTLTTALKATIGFATSAGVFNPAIRTVPATPGAVYWEVGNNGFNDFAIQGQGLTPSVILDNATGNVNFNSHALSGIAGLTVASGTTAVQALTATTVKIGSGSGATLAGGYLDVTTDIGMTSTNGIVVGSTRVLAFTAAGCTFNAGITATTGTFSGAISATSTNFSSSITFNGTLITLNSTLTLNINGSDLFSLASTACVISTIYNNTTASSANVNITSPGLIQRSTSASKYKKNVRTLTFEESARMIFGGRPVKYYSNCIGDDQDREFIGLIAEESDAIDYRYTHYNEKGEAEGLMYERYTAPLMSVAQNHESRIKELETEIKQLRGN